MKTEYFDQDYSYSEESTLSDFKSFLQQFSAEFKDNSLVWVGNFFSSNKQAKSTCEEHLKKFFGDFNNDIAEIQSWEDVANALDKNAFFAYYDGSLFHGPTSDETMNKTICGYINLFYLTVNNNILTVQAHAQKAEEFPFGAALVLSTKNIIDLANRHVDDLGSMEKFTFINELRKQLNTNKVIMMNLEFHQGRIFATRRNLDPLDQWLKETVYRLTPMIAVKSKDQLESLRVFFISQVEGEKLIIDDLDSLLHDRFYLADSKKPKQPNRSSFRVTKGDKGKASETISELFKRIDNLKSGNSIRDIQKWIYCTFFYEESEGFSLHHIKKITES